MGRVRKHSVEAMHQICLDYLEGQGSYQSLAQQLNVAKKTIKLWVSTYKKHGQDRSSIKHEIVLILKNLKKKWFKSKFKGKGLCLI